jgi:gamma-glutamyltranspeptidase
MTKKIIKEKKLHKPQIMADMKPIEYKNFETTDKQLAYKLSERGHKVKSVKSPFGDRKEKLYIFHESKEDLNV